MLLRMPGRRWRPDVGRQSQEIYPRPAGNPLLRESVEHARTWPTSTLGTCYNQSAGAGVGANGRPHASWVRSKNDPEEKDDVEPFLGQIQLLPYNFAPQGWALCDGQVLPISENTALFSLLGTNFGGDGRQTFALPKLAGPSEAVAYYIALVGIFPQRS